MTRILARAERHPSVALILFCLLCWLPGWFTIPATDRDESRFAQATRQMLETGDFLDIRNGTQARNRKPIGIYWLQAGPAAAARAAGIARDNPIWPYRLPSLLGALAAVLTTAALGRRWFGARAGLLAGAMLGASALLTVEAHLAKTDAALLGATTLAMAVLARAYLGGAGGLRWPGAALFWLAVGVGILIKGPITPMVAGLTAAALVIADRRWRWLGALRPAWGVPLALALVLPWLVAIEASTHGAFLRQAVGGDLGRKLAGGDDAHGAPPGYHALLLAVTLFPSGWLAARAAPWAWSARARPAARFMLAWLVPSWLVFELTPTKLPHYPLPLFPPLCLLLAAWAARPAAAAATAERRWLVWGASGLCGLACLVFAAGAAALPFVVGAPFWLGLPALLAAAGVAALVLPHRSAPGRAAVAGLCAAPLLWWAVLALELPEARPLWVSRAVAARAAGAPLAAVGYAEPSLMFAAGTGTRWLVPEAAAAWLRAAPQPGPGRPDPGWPGPGRPGLGRVVAVERADLPAFRAVAGDAVAGATVSGFDYSKGRGVRITLFRAPADGAAAAPK